jgi:hypothetical protein
MGLIVEVASWARGSSVKYSRDHTRRLGVAQWELRSRCVNQTLVTRSWSSFSERQQLWDSLITLTSYESLGAFCTAAVPTTQVETMYSALYRCCPLLLLVPYTETLFYLRSKSFSLWFSFGHHYIT